MEYSLIAKAMLYIEDLMQQNKRTHCMGSESTSMLFEDAMSRLHQVTIQSSLISKDGRHHCNY